MSPTEVRGGGHDLFPATWALTGSYTGPDTISADFTATFKGSCGDYTNQSFPVTATR